MERFIRTYRDEVLIMYVFNILNEVQSITEQRLSEYSEERSHDPLEDMTPIEYLSRLQSQENSSRYETKIGVFTHHEL